MITVPSDTNALTGSEWTIVVDLVSAKIGKLEYLMDDPMGYRHLASLVELREIERKLKILSGHLVEVK